MAPNNCECTCDYSSNYTQGERSEYQNCDAKKGQAGKQGDSNNEGYDPNKRSNDGNKNAGNRNYGDRNGRYSNPYGDGDYNSNYANRRGNWSPALLLTRNILFFLASVYLIKKAQVLVNDVLV